MEIYGLKGKGKKIQLTASVRVFLEEGSLHYPIAKWFFFKLHVMEGIM